MTDLTEDRISDLLLFSQTTVVALVGDNDFLQGLILEGVVSGDHSFTSRVAME